MALRIVSAKCSMVGVETGNRVPLEMRRLGHTLAQELQELLRSNAKAEKAWNTLSVGERRDFVLFVADAKKSETRMRCARRLPGPGHGVPLMLRIV